MKRLKNMLQELKSADVLLIVVCSAVQSFGIYNIHAVSKVTEGGIIGLALLFYNWFGVSPSVTTFVASVSCLIFGWKQLGDRFIARSCVAVLSVSVSYRLFEILFSPLWPGIADMPLFSAVAGAFFIGIPVGVSVCLCAASAGDDALAMGLSKLTGVSVQSVYIISDVSVLLLSLSYIPLGRIVYSLITVVLSGQIIGVIVKLNKRYAFFGKD